MGGRVGGRAVVVRTGVGHGGGVGDGGGRSGGVFVHVLHVLEQGVVAQKEFVAQRAARRVRSADERRVLSKS